MMNFGHVFKMKDLFDMPLSSSLSDLVFSLIFFLEGEREREIFETLSESGRFKFDGGGVFDDVWCFFLLGRW